VPARRKEEELRYLPADYVSKREDEILSELERFGSQCFSDL